jgi:N-acetylglucosamine kinase-like BadF-type ATPase
VVFAIDGSRNFGGRRVADLDVLLAVDAGGSSTDFILTDLAGRRIASAVTKGANVTSLGVDAACRVLANGIRDLLIQGRSSVDAVHTAVFGIAGIDREPHRTDMGEWLALALPRSQTLIVTDVELVIAAGTPRGMGLGIVSGTGSVALARESTGRTIKVGGRGPIQGDPGSGYAIGLAAIERGLLPAESESPARIAALVPKVAAAADEGDIIAIDILRTAGHDLAEQAAQAIIQIGWLSTMTPCALGGGVIVHVARVREAFVASSRARHLLFGPQTLVARPVEGAVKLARSLAAGAQDGGRL